MISASDLDTATHEAAHVVVGVALGLKLKQAEILIPDPEHDGYAFFPDATGAAGSLMYAAGIYWSRQIGQLWQSAGDRAILVELGHNAKDIKALTIAAGAILSARPEAHALVARALAQHHSIDSKTIEHLAKKVIK